MELLPILIVFKTFGTKTVRLAKRNTFLSVRNGVKQLEKKKWWDLYKLFFFLNPLEDVKRSEIKPPLPIMNELRNV